MNFEQSKRDAISIELAVDRILASTSMTYQWYAVRTKKDIIIELGGTTVEIKAYIPDFLENGEYSVYKNGCTNHLYSITPNVIEFPTKALSYRFKDIVEFIDFIDNKDFRQWQPRFEPIYETREVLIGYELTNIK